ncbi:protein of unknown function [Nakamurella panacisegetis]|uniref:DUF4349 domain-containing protein n=1 Tax=Nakamurella panacisegetis TaxID=1090615 RepID=A0A1H0JGU3_9ACTN|nr:DUF4349 domain-containing protein [Nakamurella panacisegetis]SDO42581.1 protein of unknown function [Nakamurella panacisegetis]
MGPKLFERTPGRVPEVRTRRFGALIALTALTLLLVACTGAPSQTTSAANSVASVGAGAVAAAPSAPAASSAAASAAPSSAAPSAGGGSGDAGSPNAKVNVAAGVQAENRQVIRTASVTLEVRVKSTGNSAAQVEADQTSVNKAVSDAALEVRSLANGPGFVSASSGGGATVSITLRVPVTGYESVMNALARDGIVTSVTENTQDVTAQMIDINSRVKSAADVIASLRTLLGKATKIGDILSVESQLNSREADLESMKSQLAGLSDQTSLSTITVVIKGVITDVKPVVPPKKPAPPAARSGFLGGLANGWDAARALGHAVLTVIGTVIPFLPLVLVLLIAGLIWRRRIRRGHQTPILGTGDPRSTE